MKKFLIIDSTILPSVYEKVVEAKEMLRTGKAKGITDAVKKLEDAKTEGLFSYDYGITGIPSMVEGRGDREKSRTNR